LKMRLEDYT